MHTTHSLGYGNETKILELSMARRVRWHIVFGDLKFPSLIAGPINPCEYFPVACVISQKNLLFIQYACLCEQCGFLLRWSPMQTKKLTSKSSCL